MNPALKRTIRVGLLVGILAVSLIGYAAFDSGQDMLGSVMIGVLVGLMILVTLVS